MLGCTYHGCLEMVDGRDPLAKPQELQSSNTKSEDRLGGEEWNCKLKPMRLSRLQGWRSGKWSKRGTQSRWEAEPYKGIALSMLLTVSAASRAPQQAHTSPPLSSVEEAVLNTMIYKIYPWPQMIG